MRTCECVAGPLQAVETPQREPDLDLALPASELRGNACLLFEPKN